MRAVFSSEVERGRVLSGSWGSRPGDDYGAFLLRLKSVDLKIIASSGTEEIPWEHVSVSTKIRCPTWAEMSWVKDLFFEEEETVLQFHPPKSKYVNHHPYCLHLWKPHALEVPLPPMIAVGPMASPSKHPRRSPDACELLREVRAVITGT